MFLINIVLGSIGLALAWNVLPRTKADRTVVLDGLGAGLLVAAMLLIIYSLIEGSTSGWSPLVAGIGVGGIACLIAFGGRQRVAPNPLIEPSLLKNRGFTAGLVMALAFFAVVSGLGYVLSLFLQQGTGRTPVETALTGIAPMAAGIMIASIAAAPLMARLARGLVLAGLLVTVAGVLILMAVVATQGTSIAIWALVAPMFVIGLGMGFCIGTLFDIAVGDVDQKEAGSASGSLSAVQQIASALGAAIITSVWFWAVATGVSSAMVTCLVVVVAVLVGCCGLVTLLPRKAADPGITDGGLASGVSEA